MGNVTKVQQPNGTGTVTKSYTYDALNRPNTVTYSDGTPEAYFWWDAASPAYGIGRLSSVSNSNSTTNYTYDPLGRPLTSSQQTPGYTARSFAYTYDFANDLMSETLPSGRVVTNTLDAVGRPSTLSGTLNSASTTYISSSQYWPTGAPWHFVRGSNNNIWSVASYNSRLQLQESYEAISDGRDTPTSTNYDPKLMLFVSCPNWGVQTNSDWGAWIICPAENRTNENGTLQGYQEFLGGPGSSALQNIQQTFTYDGLNRLKTAQEATSSWNRTYTYDQWGNMAPSTSNSVIPLAANSPTGFNSATNQISTPGIFSYDNGGNLTALNGNTLAYDAEKRLKSVNGLGISETVSYDATGQRVQKSLSSGSTAYVYDAFGNLSTEYVNGTTWSRDYIRWGGGQLIATENASGPCTTCYFSYDHLGSVRLVTDANANIIARHDYLPYGEEIAAGVGGRNSQFGLTTDTTAKFTGQLRDQEAGQDYFNARYFAAVLGRFHSPDPMSVGANLAYPQSWNGYGYVLGNPLGLTDPTGMYLSVCELLGTCGGPGGGIAGGDGGGKAPIACAIAGDSDLHPRNCGSGPGGSGGSANKPAQNPPPAPKPVVTCVYNSGQGGALGLGYGGQADLGLGFAGASLSGSVGGGYFLGEGADGKPNSLSAGLQAFASGGATAYAGGNVVGAPKPTGQPFVFGGFYGGGPFLFASTAQSAQQMSGPSATYSLNVGIGFASFGVQLSSFGTGWQASFSPPIPYVSSGFGFAVSKTTTNTVPLTPPLPTSCPPPGTKPGSGSSGGSGD